MAGIGINPRLEAGLSGGATSQVTYLSPGGEWTNTNQFRLSAGVAWQATPLTTVFVYGGGVAQYTLPLSDSDNDAAAEETVPPPPVDDGATIPVLNTDLEGLPEWTDHFSAGWTAGAGVNRTFERFSARLVVGMGHSNFTFKPASADASTGQTTGVSPFNLFAPSGYGPYATLILSTNNPDARFQSLGVTVSQTTQTTKLDPNDESEADETNSVRESTVTANGFGTLRLYERTKLQFGVTLPVSYSMDLRETGQDPETFPETFYDAQAHVLGQGALRLVHQYDEYASFFMGAGTALIRPAKEPVKENDCDEDDCDDEPELSLAYSGQFGLNLAIPGLCVNQAIIPSMTSYYDTGSEGPLVFGWQLTYYLTPNVVLHSERVSAVARQGTFFTGVGGATDGSGYFLAGANINF